MKRATIVGVVFVLAVFTAGARGGSGQEASDRDRGDNAEKIKAIAEQVTQQPAAEAGKAEDASPPPTQPT